LPEKSVCPARREIPFHLCPWGIFYKYFSLLRFYTLASGAFSFPNGLMTFYEIANLGAAKKTQGGSGPHEEKM